MSSPIHQYLFSPPPSPPRRPADLESAIPPTPRLTSLKTLLLPVDLIPRTSLDAPTLSELKPRSPRTPRNNQFTFDSTFPSHESIEFDIEKSPRLMNPEIFETPRQRKGEKTIASPPYLPTNVPSAPTVLPTTLPRPLIRLIFLASLLLSSVLLLILVPSARLPSLRAASVSRRLLLDEDGRAYYDVHHSVSSFEQARDRDYTPPQVRISSLSKRAIIPPAAMETIAAVAPRPTRATSPRPLPASHELLALQSYLLQSDYNVLPQFTDPNAPLDANAVLSVGSHHLGLPGSPAEAAWLAELEAEHADDVVVWYGGNGVAKRPLEILTTLEDIHGPSKKPTLVPCHGRSDLAVLRGIFNRFGVDIQHHPLIMIGTTPIVGDADTLKEMSNSGKLDEMLDRIGWGKKHAAKSWKPKVAKVAKKELSELELALQK